MILLDISMSSLSGLEVIPYFRATVPDVSMVILTLQDKTFYPPALAAGASAFVSKFELITDLLPAIRQVVQWQ